MYQNIEEDNTFFRVRIRDPVTMDRFRVKDVGVGMKITVGRIKGSKRWEVQNYLFEKSLFKSKEQVRQGLEQHLKAQIKSMLDYRAWDEWRRRFVSAYMQISQVTPE